MQQPRNELRTRCGTAPEIRVLRNCSIFSDRRDQSEARFCYKKQNPQASHCEIYNPFMNSYRVDRIGHRLPTIPPS